MKVIIAGGTGMIGWALAQDLARDGHIVVILTRRNNSGNTGNKRIRFVKWDGKKAGDWVNELEKTDAVVNLVGENLSNSLWSRKQKERIISSRVDSGKALVEGVKKARNKPVVFIQASGSGAYGTSEQKVFQESDDYGNDFLANVTKEWETSTFPIEEMNVRRVIIRSGVVFGKEKGALRLMLLPFKFYAGGVLGSGRQWISWIHLQDEVRAIRFLIDNEQASGVFNLSAIPVRNAQFSPSAARALHRPSWFSMPAFLLRFALGEMSTMVLDGQNISSKKIEGLGFKFLYPKIDEALSNLL
jgi:uncharacterized protein (TIGR01777 family)